MAVSRGCPEMLCGNQRLSWFEIKRAIEWLNKSGSKHRTERMKFVNNIQEVIGRHQWNPELEDTVSHLHVLLHLASSSRATDPRDKVFALLGLSSAGQGSDDWPEELAPNYTRPVQDVYAAAAKYCIRQTGSLSVLSQFVDDNRAGATSSHLQFPSWVPRWDLGDTTRPISAISLHWGPGGLRNLTEKYNKASKDTRVMMDQDAPLSILRVLGVHTDTVKVCLPTVMPDESSFHAKVPERCGDYLFKVIPQLYRTCQKHVTHISESFDITFSLVTSAGLGPDDFDARKERAVNFASLINDPQGWANTRPHLLDSNDQPQRHGTKPSQPQSYAGSKNRHARYVRSLKHLMNRCLFVTSSGHLGLGPASMMSGDTVAILFGGKVPYILRPLENRQWHFVGECYLDGYMNGEALDNEGEHPSNHEWFEMV